MPAFTAHHDFAFSPALTNAFDPCMPALRKRTERPSAAASPTFVPIKRKKRAISNSSSSSSSSSHAQPMINALSDASAVAAELATLSGQALFERLVALPLAQIDYVCCNRKQPWDQDNIAALCDALRTTSSSTACITALVRHVVAPNVDGLQKRVLLTHVIEHVPERSLLDGLVIPLLAELTRPRVQTILKLPLSPTSRTGLLRAVCTDPALRPWPDALLHLVERTLAQPPLLTPIAPDVAATLVAEANLQVLLVLTTKYAQMLVDHQLLDPVETKALASQQVLKRAVLGQVASIRRRLRL